MKKIGLAVVIVLIGIQLIQPARNKNGQVFPTDISKTISIPENIQLVLQTACYDCHIDWALGAKDSLEQNKR